MLTLSSTDMEHFYASQAGSASKGSMQCWKTALDWLDDCNNNHPECKVSQKPEFYPTRLIAIGDNNDLKVRVIESATEHPVGGYMTLSHRWGEETPIKLTKHACEELRTSISLQKLPMTFQHAIEIYQSTLQTIYLD
jgi:hypothetical protein